LGFPVAAAAHICNKDGSLERCREIKALRETLLNAEE
jgi:hypothetical protein